jgi:hypothetical protein
MYTLTRAAVSALVLSVLAASGSTNATEVLTPMHPVSAMIGDRGATVYYTPRPEGYHVVVTLAALTPDSATSMRTTVTLLPGQRQLLTIDGGPGCSPATLEIVRNADTVTVDSSPGVGVQSSSH